MNNTITLITQDVADKVDIKKLNLQSAQIISKSNNLTNNILGKKQNTIHLYDLGFNKHNRIIPIHNHINKTGVNAMRDNPNKQIEFYDITNIYQNQNQAQIAECFGHHPPTKKRKNYAQTRFLCNHAIALYCFGYKTIFAYIVD